MQLIVLLQFSIQSPFELHSLGKYVHCRPLRALLHVLDFEYSPESVPKKVAPNICKLLTKMFGDIEFSIFSGK